MRTLRAHVAVKVRGRSRNALTVLRERVLFFRVPSRPASAPVASEMATLSAFSSPVKRKADDDFTFWAGLALANYPPDSPPVVNLKLIRENADILTERSKERTRDAGIALALNGQFVMDTQKALCELCCVAGADLYLARCAARNAEKMKMQAGEERRNWRLAIASRGAAVGVPKVWYADNCGRTHAK